MENASKALIIAGAILISILLIGIGVALINALNAPMDEAAGAMDEQTMQIFNNKFDKYVGKQSGTNVLSLISQAITSNQAADNNGSGHKVTIKRGGTSAVDSVALSGLKNNINKSSTYTVTITGYSNGFISEMTVTP